MSKEKVKKKKQWGGFREGSGRKERPGGTAKICISVTNSVWQDAMKLWNGNRSQLFDHLLHGFVKAKATP